MGVTGAGAVTLVGVSLVDTVGDGVQNVGTVGNSAVEVELSMNVGDGIDT